MEAAMSTSMHSPNPELTPQILAELRAQLERARDRLTAQIAAGRRAEGAGDTPEQDPDFDIRGDEGDQSVDLQAWDDTQQGLLDRQAQLAAVDRALAKFDAGTYGMGERSGRPIPLARLRLVPEARDDVADEDLIDRTPR
jgi:DnaK suppressor protein